MRRTCFSTANHMPLQFRWVERPTYSRLIAGSSPASGIKTAVNCIYCRFGEQAYASAATDNGAAVCLRREIGSGVKSVAFDL